jgi:type VI protein secretion system component Hcp
MRSHRITRTIAALFALAVTAVAAPALANNFYLEIATSGSLTPQPNQPLTSIPSSWITVNSFSWGVAQPQPSGGGGGLPHATGSLTVTGVDSATAQTLFKDATTGVLIQAVRLVITQPSGKNQVPTEIIAMQNAYVTSATMSGGSQTVSDTFTFNYQVVQYEYASAQGTPSPNGSFTLIWKPDLTRPSMTTVRPFFK